MALAPPLVVMSKDSFQMTPTALGRVGLLSSILLGLASSSAMAEVRGLELGQGDALTSARQDPKGADAARQAEVARKKAAISAKKKAAVQAQNSKARGGGKGALTHEGELVNARYGGDLEPNAKLDVKFGTENHNFGQVVQGQVLEHTFMMGVGGTKDLVIRQAKPTCGCTVSKVLVEGKKGEFGVYEMGTPIPPGKSVQITAAMDTKNKNNKAEVRINVYTNDPIGLYQLGLSAKVEPFMTAAPSYLNLGDLSEDTVREEKVTVRTSRGQKIKLAFDDSTPRPAPAGMSFEMVPINPTDDGRSNHWEVKVTVGPGLREGPMGYAMRLISDVEIAGAVKSDEHGADDGHGHDADDGHGHGADDGHGHGDDDGHGKPDKAGKTGKPNFYQVSANVGGRVVGVLSVSPQYLSMGLVRPGQPVSRSVRIVSTDLALDPSKIKATIQGTAGGDFAWSEHFTPIVRPIEGQAKAMEVELRLDGLPEGSEGSFKGEMIVQTGVEAKPEMKVTFSGVCRVGVGRSTKAGGR